MDDPLLWPIRTYVYGHFAAATAAPSAAEVAAHFGLSLARAEAVLRALHDRHALFLEPGTTTIRMANPFSAVATSYRVTAGGRVYRANCAWDCFGVVAALGASEATIDAPCAATGQALRIDVAGGALLYDGRPVVEGAPADGPPIADGLPIADGPPIAHFLVPFAHWYDDLVHT